MPPKEEKKRKEFTVVIGASIRDVTDGDPSAFCDLGIVYQNMHEEQRQVLTNFLNEYGDEIMEALQPYASLLTELGNMFLAGNPEFQSQLKTLKEVIKRNPPAKLKKAAATS